MKEGSIENMWRLNLDDLQKLTEDPYFNCQWELVNFSGSGPGRISHHTCSVQGDKMILIGGKDYRIVYHFVGLQGD